MTPHADTVPTALLQTSVPNAGVDGSRKTWKSVGVALILFSAIWFTYRSSLAHAPRSDQWSVFLDTIDQEGFVGNFSRTYSYNRTRVAGPGDYELFRPVLFTLLSAEKAIFGNHFVPWQWVGIVLHFLTVYLALQVMLRIRRLVAPEPANDTVDTGWFTESFFLRVLPYGLTIFFGMNFAISEIVIWSHINGYVLFVVLVLAGILLLLEYWSHPCASALTQMMLLAGAWLLLLLSTFTHELGQLFAVTVGLVLAMTELTKGRLGRGLALFSLFAGLLLLYQGMNYLDKRSHPETSSDLDLSTVVRQAASKQSFEHARRYILFTAVQPFFPSCAAWVYSGERLQISEPGAVLGNYRRGGPILLVSYLVLAAGLLLAARGFYYFLRGKRAANRLLLLLPVSLFALHLGLTVFGRMNMRPMPEILSSNSYYTYVPLLALVMGLCLILSCVPRDTVRGNSSPVRYLYGAFLGGMAILTLCSGEQVCAINVVIKDNLRPLRTTGAWLAEFVDCHRHESDFSFAFDEDSYEDMDTHHGIPLPMILFKRYLNNLNPKYLVSVRGCKCSAALFDADHAASPIPHRQLFPDLVKIGTFYNFYYYDGVYYGVWGKDGYYRPDRERYEYLITDPTLEGALSQVAGKLRELEDDRKAGKEIHFGYFR